MKSAANVPKTRKKATKTTKKQTAVQHKPLPNVLALSQAAGKLLWAYKKQFAVITVVYALLLIVLVQGLKSTTDISALKGTLSAFFTGNVGSLASGATIFVVLVGTAGANATSNGAYQLFVAIVISLVLIWALRQAKAGSQFTVRDAFYKSMYPFIPFILVLLVICVQLIPILVGTVLYSAAVSGVAATVLERSIFMVLYVLLALWSGYMLTSSIFALYIVALPDMTPLKALRSARDLVKKRRWSVVRKILFAPLAILLIFACIMIPIIIVATPIARYVFFALTTSVVVILHSYFYTLYRELIDD